MERLTAADALLADGEVTNAAVTSDDPLAKWGDAERLRKLVRDANADDPGFGEALPRLVQF